jgi:DNA-binding MarR family transcriptional regulator
VSDGSEERDADEGVLRFVERFAMLLADAGMPRMAARVFALLLADDDARMTAGRLASTLRVSPAAVSGAVRYLTQAGLTERRRDPGARTDHYTLAGPDVWADMFEYRFALTTGWEQALAEGAALLGDDRPGGRRLRESQAFLAFLRHEMPGLLDRWRAEKQALVARELERSRRA